MFDESTADPRRDLPASRVPRGVVYEFEMQHVDAAVFGQPLREASHEIDDFQAFRGGVVQHHGSVVLLLKHAWLMNIAADGREHRNPVLEQHIRVIDISGQVLLHEEHVPVDLLTDTAILKQPVHVINGLHDVNPERAGSIARLHHGRPMLFDERSQVFPGTD